MIKHFIDLDNFTKTELRNILSFATKIKKNQDIKETGKIKYIKK